MKYIFYTFLFVFFSCEKKQDVVGCSNSNATNYIPGAVGCSSCCTFSSAGFFLPRTTFPQDPPILLYVDGQYAGILSSIFSTNPSGCASTDVVSVAITSGRDIEWKAENAKGIFVNGKVTPQRGSTCILVPVKGLP